MNLSIKELNELIYSLGITAHKGMFVNKDINESLLEKFYSELNSKIADETEEEKAEEVESDTYYVSNEEADEDYRSTLKQDAQRYEASHMTTSFSMVDPFTSDSEDLTSAQNNEYDRYESSVEKDYDNHLKKLKQRGYITQSILDFVELQGDATHMEIHNFYRKFTGSNSFSYVLRNLIVPYKNRPTKRYLVKMSGGNYEVRIANPSNWVIVDC